ncbi:hypothetical protein DFH07DRAFT_838966 [Mycena maculata]|uniref:RRM domain-containing protein n=1 Tax=Mycena maculata TaxID=230809 RepID=A0AAD7IFU9_9AGAR|nr:hypothetical protein DFH07DRAFT_838966 [Mycena maculata]
MQAASAFRRGTRYIPEPLRRATQIKLSNVPTTAIPADLRRLINRAQVQGVEHAAIDYHRFEPSGHAYLQLKHSDFLLPNLAALEKVSLSGVHLVAEPSNREPMSEQFDGNGLSSELDSNGKNVVVWGLPKAIGPEVLDRLIQGFNFPPGEPYIFKLPTLPFTGRETFTLACRFMVRLTSESEAHRLVRELHMTPYWPDLHGTKYPIRARVIY